MVFRVVKSGRTFCRAEKNLAKPCANCHSDHIVNAQATACPPIRPAVVIGDWLRGLCALFVGNIYNYDGPLRPAANQGSLVSVCGVKIRQYTYDAIRIIPHAITMVEGVFPITISPLTAFGIRRVYDFIFKNATTTAFENIRLSKPHESRTAGNRAAYPNGRYHYDARFQLVAPSTRTVTQRR